MTDIYTAVLRAAEHIERNPGQFDFGRMSVPRKCGAPGCAIGWIGYFAGLHGVYVCNAATDLMLAPSERHRSDPLGVHGRNCEFGFYNRMKALAPTDWQRNPTSCAAGLRAYAAKYLRAPQATPDWEALAERLAAEPKVEQVTA